MMTHIWGGYTTPYYILKMEGMNHMFSLGRSCRYDMNNDNTTDELIRTDGTTKTVELFSYFVYDDKRDKIIDSIMLTDEQANKLNNIIAKLSDKDSEAVLLRLIRS